MHRTLRRVPTTAGGPPRVSRTRRQSISVRRVNFHKVAAGLDGEGGLVGVSAELRFDILNATWVGNTRLVYKCNGHNVVAQDMHETRLYRAQ